MGKYQRKSIFLSLLLGALLIFFSWGVFSCGKDTTSESVSEKVVDSGKIEKSKVEKNDKEKLSSKEKVVEKVKESVAEKIKEPVKEPAVEPALEPDITKDAADEPLPEESLAVEEPAIEQPAKEQIPENGGPIPVVKITQPADGAIVKCSITIKVDAKVGKGASIDKVELFIDGHKIQETNFSPYEFMYDTKSIRDGQHKISVIATTNWGQKGKDEISVKVANLGPQITFIKPALNSTVSGKFDIEVTVKDGLGLKQGSVLLAVDGASVPWSSTGKTYKASFDPKGKPFDTLPIVVTAENVQGVKSEKILWVLHVLAPGPKKSGEECDNSDPKKRCVAKCACLRIGGSSAKALCYPMCTVGSTTHKCAPVIGKNIRCQVAWQGMQRGVCIPWTPPPGSLYSKCGGTIRCTNPNHVCVGVTGSGVSYCLEKCSGAGGKCKEQGFFCAPLSSGGGACIEKCGQSCSSNSDCSKGQTCTSGTCTGTFCPNYGTCRSLSGLSFKICI